jgi:hypothetical protein
MEVAILGRGPTAPFLSARDRFATEYDLDRPVEVRIVPDSQQRTRTGHSDDGHVLIISHHAASGVMARDLAVHEFAHMRRHEAGHPSHTVPTGEVLHVALAGDRVDSRIVAHCHQIANHMKDIYADDLTLDVGPGDRLVAMLESRLAAAMADREPASTPVRGRGSIERTGAAITAVNAAFALALAERHDLVGDDHRLYDLAHAAGDDAPTVDLDRFRRLFRSLGESRSYRAALTDAVREYAAATAT